MTIYFTVDCSDHKLEHINFLFTYLRFSW